jgi:acyl carrier protein
MTQDDILADLADLLSSFQGREYSDEIGRDTRFFADLGFASIDAVVLGEELEKRYGRKIAFSTLLGELARRGAIDIEVGELVDFLHGQLAGPHA